MSLNFNLNSLVTFMAVAETCSFRGAADKLHTSQSAVSSRVRQLEERLGVRLFDRTTRSVNLTAQGQQLFAVARSAYADMTHVAEAFRKEATLQSGEITLAAVPSLAQTVVPAIMAEFGQLHPGIRLRLLDVDSRRSLDMMDKGEVDLAIVSEIVEQRNMLFEPLFWDECFLLLPKGHALENQRNVSLRHLKAYPLMLSPHGTTLRQVIEKAFLSAGLPLVADQQISNMSTLARMVEAGFGIGIAPGISLRQIDLSGCTVISLREKIGWTVGVARMSSRSESPASIAFRQLLAEKYPSSAVQKPRRLR